MKNISKIGEKIKIFRKKLGLQANKLADQLNISPSYLNLIENGKRNVDANLLLKICHELRIELSELENLKNSSIEIISIIASIQDIKRMNEILSIFKPEKLIE